jgi:hypothetical protein
MLLAALASGCSKKTSHDASAAPGEAGEAGGGDDLAALEQQLARRESELQAVGISPMARKQSIRDGGGSNDAAARSEAEVGASAGGDASAPVPSTGPAPTTAPPPADPDREPDAPGRCERVCEISAAICTLEQQICGLLPRHRGEARYQDACDRAIADCQLATEACHACTAN